MKWIRTENGKQAHVVLRGATSTLCGIPLEHAAEIVIPGPDDRCENCDHVWRRGAGALEPEDDDPLTYDPRHRNDWETQ